MASLTSGEQKTFDEWPTTLESYELKEKIGRGAFATVYRAVCTVAPESQRIVAMKVMDLQKITGKLEDVRSEVVTMKKNVHPNVLSCLACFDHGKSLYLVMPYMDRGSALHVMSQMKSSAARAAGLSESWVKYILCEVLKGIQYLHDQKLIHRDIKAGNILLNSNGEVKIADFGVSTFMQEKGQDRDHATFVGTVCWMAPEVMEQMNGYAYPADVWSIGITALELVKGYAPYATHAPMKVLLMTLQQPPPSLETYEDEKTGHQTVSGTEWASKSSHFKKFVKSCLKRDPNERATVAQLSAMKFVNYSKLANLNNAKATFATELSVAIAPIHELVVEKQKQGDNNAKNASEEGTEKVPEWDYQDVYDDDGGFGAEFNAATTLGE
jgi:serine/threonine-protein kinase OSR1/STK39